MPYASSVQQAEYHRRYYRANREKKADQNRRWAAANPEKMLASARRQRKAHPDRISANQRRWRRANREKANAWSRLCHAANREKHAAVCRSWKKRNPEKVLAMEQRRRAQRAGSLRNDFDAKQWRALKEAFRHRCAYCKVKTRKLTQDHVIPLSRGGTHTASNIVPACRSCNARKHAGTAPDFQPILMMLAGKEE